MITVLAHTIPIHAVFISTSTENILKINKTAPLQSCYTYLKNSKVGQWVKNGLSKVQPYLTKAKNAVTGVATKCVDFVKNLFKKAPVTPTP